MHGVSLNYRVFSLLERDLLCPFIDLNYTVLHGWGNHCLVREILILSKWLICLVLQTHLRVVGGEGIERERRRGGEGREREV